MNFIKKLLRYKIELVSIGIIIILSLLRLLSKTISLKLFILAISTQVFIIIIKHIYLFIRSSRTIDSFKHQATDMAESIDRVVSEWIDGLSRITFNTNEFFQWLLPEVNVNISCAEHKPHRNQSFRSGLRAANLCLEHKDYLREYEDNRIACFFHLKNIPQKIEERLDLGFQKRRDEPVSIELRRGNQACRQKKARLIGWNVFGLMFKYSDCTGSSKDLQNEEIAFFMKTTTRTETVIARKVGQSLTGVRHIKYIFHRAFGIQLCVRLNIDSVNSERAIKNGFLFASFPYQFKQVLQHEIDNKVNEPICKLHYEQDAIKAHNPTYNLIYPRPPKDFKELVLSGSKSLDELDYIQHLKKLEVLSFDDTNVEDLSPIRDFYELKKLSFNFTKVKNLEPLKNLTNLRELKFDSTNITSLEPIRNLKDLEVLHFTNTPIRKLEPIENLVLCKD